VVIQLIKGGDGIIKIKKRMCVDGARENKRYYYYSG
jgi:hypothetical protein